jgi:hypothetical protein
MTGLLLAYISGHVSVGDLRVRLGFHRLERREIRLEVKDGWLGAYVIDLSREHQRFAGKGLTLWERLECDLVPFESSTLV